MIKHGKHRVYYSMGEVAEMFDLTPSLIRYWESQFDILKPDKNRKGNRMFTPKDVDNLKVIYHLVKEKGMTLKGAQRRIESSMDEIQRNVEIVDKLLNIKSVLLEIREELNRVETGARGVELLFESAGMDEQQQSESLQEMEMESFDVAQQGWSVVDGLGAEVELAVELSHPPRLEDELAKEREQQPVQKMELTNDDHHEAHIEEEQAGGRMILDEKIAHLVQTLIDPEVVPEYISHLSEELSDDAQTAIEVMETLIEMDEEEEEEQLEAREQTLF